MSCDQNTNLHAYHDGELAAGGRAAFEAHLRECAVCAEQLDELRRLGQMLKNAPMEPISPIALARLERAYDAVRDRGVRRVAGWLTAAAAAVLVGVMLIPSEPAPDVTASAAPWQTIAVMPPADTSDEPIPELVLAAQWMANDLASFDTAGAGERP